jgi:NTE family protein
VAGLEALGQQVGTTVVEVLPASEERGPRLEALGRRLVGRRVGLALGAGGPLLWAHVGVIRSLMRAGIPIDCVTGTSAGAIVGSGLAMGLSIAEIYDRLLGVGKRILRPVFPLRGVLTNRPVARWARREIYGDQLIEETKIPLALSAADLDEGAEIVLRRGPMWRAVLASAAIPGIYPAVRIGNHWLVDGGVVNPVPVATAHLLGADVVVAVDLSVPLAPRHELDERHSARRRPPMLLNNVLRSRDIMMSVIQAHSLAQPSVLVKPQVEGATLREFNSGSRFIEGGEAAMEEALPRLLRQLPWLNSDGA